MQCGVIGANVNRFTYWCEKIYMYGSAICTSLRFSFFHSRVTGVSSIDLEVFEAPKHMLEDIFYKFLNAKIWKNYVQSKVSKNVCVMSDILQ